MVTREAGAGDSESIEDVYLAAFPEGEGGSVAGLALKLLGAPGAPGSFSLVAEVDGAIVGHIAFSPVRVRGEPAFKGAILSPLGVKPGFHGRSIGTGLVEQGLQKLKGQGVQVVFVYGDPAYYGRFGFTGEVAGQFLPPYRLQYPSGWQAMVLTSCHLGRSPAAITCVAALRDPGLW